MVCVCLKYQNPNRHPPSWKIDIYHNMLYGYGYGYGYGNGKEKCKIEIENINIDTFYLPTT